MTRLSAILFVGALAAACAPAPTPVVAVESVDLDRYLGEWFEIARLPNSFQQDCAGDVTAQYTLRADGDIDVVNRCRGADGSPIQVQGVARQAEEGTSSRLEVRFAPEFLALLPFVWGDYWILGLAGDYSWAVVGSPDREYLWILSRTPALDEMRYSAALAIADANGFDVRSLARTRQGQ
jgi:apolipoprotein D and lipocalin family protein